MFLMNYYVTLIFELQDIREEKKPVEEALEQSNSNLSIEWTL